MVLLENKKENFINIETKKNRESNIELLRIFAMLLIIIFHFSDWGKLLNLSQISLSNTILGIFINSFGKLGVNIFALISGYFLINKKFKVKKLLKIILEVFFYSVMITISLRLSGLNHVSNTDIIRAFFPISNNVYWFATAYVFMYLLSPFINKFLKILNKKQLNTLLIILVTTKFLIPTIVFNGNNPIEEFSLVIIVYIIGAFLRINEFKFFKDNKKNLLISIILLLFIFIVNVLCFLFNYKLLLNSLYSLPLLVLSIYIFQIFKNMKIEENIFINFLAKSSFSVYLIHINSLFRPILFFKIIRIQNFYNSNTLILLLFIILISILIYLICTVIDYIRIILIEKPIFKIKKFDIFFNKLDEIINLV